jgi:hypothetical protein
METVKRVKLHNKYELFWTVKAKKATCLDCDGTGELILPAYNSAGEIVDEQQHACACTVEDNDEVYDDR